MTSKTVDQYRDWPELILPIKHSRLDLNITKVDVFCAKCNRPTTMLRGVAREWHSCIEVEFAGVCRLCKNVTFARKFRWYLWGVLEFREGRGWVAIENGEIFWCCFFKAIIKRLLKR